MGIDEFFNGFSLKNDLIPNNKIRIITMRQNNALVSHFITFFTAKRNVRTTQFDNRGVFVKDFVVALSEFAMNLHAKPNELKNLFLVKQFAHSC